MKTDTLFYKLFQSFPQLLFQLIDQPVIPGYHLVSVEVKEKGFRFDGIFAPPDDSSDRFIYFVEVQFQSNPDFYRQFLSEIFLYLNQQNPQQDWKAIAIFPSSKQDTKELSSIHQELINSGRIVRVYLDEITAKAEIKRSPELGMIKLITCPESEAVEVVNEMRSGLAEEDIIRFIGDILFYKFPKLRREEIEAMFALDDIRQARVFQEALQEGIQIGKQEGIQLGKQEGIQLGKQEGIQLGKQEGIQLGKQEGIQTGIQLGELNTKRSIARELLGKLPIAEIASVTGLPIDEIQALTK